LHLFIILLPCVWFEHPGHTYGGFVPYFSERGVTAAQRGMGINGLSRDPLALTQKPYQRRPLRPHVHVPGQTYSKASPVAKWRLLKFPETHSNFQNSYLLIFKPKSLQTSPKTLINSSSIYLRYLSYYAMYWNMFVCLFICRVSKSQSLRSLIFQTISLTL
jgi:hypothetical protein